MFLKFERKSRYFFFILKSKSFQFFCKATPDEMKVIADCIADCVFDFANKKDEVASKVEELTKKFPLYE